MGIVAVGVMDGNVGAHPSATNCSRTKSCRSAVCCSRESSMGNAATNSRARRLSLVFPSPPRRSRVFPVLPFQGGHWRQEHRLPDKPLFAGVVVLHPIVLVEHPGAAQIGGSGHSGAPRAPADHLRLQMIDRHSFSFPPAYRLFLFLYKENGRAPAQGRAHLCGKAAGGRFAQADGNCVGWRFAIPSQAGCMDDDSSAGRAVASSSGPAGDAIPSESTRWPKAIPPPRAPAKSRTLWGEEAQGSGRSFRRQAETEASGLCDDEVVSSALREKKGRSPVARRPSRVQNRIVTASVRDRFQGRTVPCPVPPASPSPKSPPPGSAAVSGPCASSPGHAPGLLQPVLRLQQLLLCIGHRLTSRFCQTRS